MIERFYNGTKLLEEYSKFGEVKISQMSNVAKIIPHVEQRVEIIVDDSVDPEMELDDIPPHLKRTIDLYFVNSPAIYPTKYLMQCVSPGQLQGYNGRAWVDIDYREDWAEYEEYIKDMEHIYYPFVVLPNMDFHPRTWSLLDEGRMRLFKTLLQDNHKQVTIKEFEEKWIHIFNPAHQDNPQLPIAAWLSVAGNASSYVDVIEITSDRQAIVLFTVPPIMSFNEGETSIMDGKTPINIQNVIMRCRSESAVIPRSGDTRFLDIFTEASTESEVLSKHMRMWKVIYERYGWSFITDGSNTVNNQTPKQAINGSGSIADDQMEDIVF